MTLFTLANVKTGLGEVGTTNDSKISTIYGPMADQYIKSYTNSIQGMPNPPETVTGVILTAQQLIDLKKYADILTISYFYKGESGDTITAEQAERNFLNYFMNTWRRVRFKVTTPI